MRTCWWLAGVLGLAWFAPLAALAADEPGDGGALLAEVAKAYKDLPGYADTGTMRIEMKVGEKTEAVSTPMAVRLVRPGKLAIDGGSVQVTCDGERLTVALVPLKKVTVLPAPKKLSIDAFSNNAMGALLFSGPSAPAMELLLTLLLDDDATRRIQNEARQVTLEADAQDEGAARKALRVHAKQGPDLRLLIDPATKLVRRIELVPSEADLARVKDQVGVTGVAIAWVSGAVSTEKPADTAFTTQPPAGFSRVAELSALAEPGQDRKGPFEELMGKPAPDFTLTVLDGEGKTRRVSKADMAGKVVMIDFWATWCPPCMAELPEVQKVVEGYAKAKKDVVVVALSIDSEPGDLEGIRKKVEQTLGEKDLKLAQGATGLIALDPSGGIARSFNVSGIPTVVLLDAKGNVQAVHVGYRPDVKDTLTDEIDTLLEGRSLTDAQPAAPKTKP